MTEQGIAQCAGDGRGNGAGGDLAPLAEVLGERSRDEARRDTAEGAERDIFPAELVYGAGRQAHDLAGECQAYF